MSGMPFVSNVRFGPEEADGAIEGFLLFKGLDAKKYSFKPDLKQAYHPSYDSKEKDAKEGAQKQEAEEKEALNQSLLVWSVLNVGGGGNGHNVAVVGAREDKDKKEVFVFNNSTAGENLTRYGFVNGFNPAILHFYPQSNGDDCGYCATFFVIEVIRQIEARQAGAPVTKVLEQLKKPKNNHLFDSKENQRSEPQGRNLAKLEIGFYLQCDILHKRAQSGPQKTGIIGGFNEIEAALRYRLKAEKTPEHEELLRNFSSLKSSEAKLLNNSDLNDKGVYFTLLSYCLLYDFNFFCFLIKNNHLTFNAIFPKADAYARDKFAQESKASKPQASTCWIFLNPPSEEQLAKAGKPDVYYYLRAGSFGSEGQLCLHKPGQEDVTEEFPRTSQQAKDRGEPILKARFEAELESKSQEHISKVAYKIENSALSDMIKRRGDGFFSNPKPNLLINEPRLIDRAFVAETDYQAFFAGLKQALNFVEKPVVGLAVAIQAVVRPPVVVQAVVRPPVATQTVVKPPVAQQETVSSYYFPWRKLVLSLGLSAICGGVILIGLDAYFLLACIFLAVGGGFTLLGTIGMLYSKAKLPLIPPSSQPFSSASTLNASADSASAKASMQPPSPASPAPRKQPPSASPS